MSTETDDRPTNLADAFDDLAFIMDGFDSLVKLLHKAGVEGFEVDGEFLELPVNIVGQEVQRDLREAARRTRHIASMNQEDAVVIEAIWPKVQQ